MENNQPNDQPLPPKKFMSRESNLSINDENDPFFIDQFEKNGIISKAKIHYSAQSVNKIPDHYDSKSTIYYSLINNFRGDIL